MEHRAGPLSQGAGAAGALLILAALEAAWLGWFLVEPLPNVANITVRLALLFGRFPYADRGIKDRTHLHFYTRRTARALLEQNGWEIVAAKTTVMPLELVLGLDPAKPPMRAITALLAAATAVFPGLLGYQFVYLARPRA